jgi:hypothetical protein
MLYAMSHLGENKPFNQLAALNPLLTVCRPAFLRSFLPVTLL